jgi:hypothetical protein
MLNRSQLLAFLAALGMTATLSAQNLPSYIPSNGLIGWYPFTGNANDSSGNGNHAAVNGAVLASDRFGNPNAAYSFNGSTDYLPDRLQDGFTLVLFQYHQHPCDRHAGIWLWRRAV